MMASHMMRNTPSSATRPPLLAVPTIPHIDCQGIRRSGSSRCSRLACKRDTHRRYRRHELLSNTGSTFQSFDLRNPPLLQPYADKNEQEAQQLTAMPICRSDVRLEQRICERQTDREDANTKCLAEPVSKGEPIAAE